jgi:outer membrane protein assembly factor BamB
MATPVFADGCVYIATGQSPEHYAGEADLFCIDSTGKGDVSAELESGSGKSAPNPNSRVVWRHGGSAPKKDDARGYFFGRTMANCAVHDGLVYACDIEGNVYCLDAATGRRNWQHDMRDPTRCGPLWADGKVYVTTEYADVWVFAHGRERKILNVVELLGGARAAPVFANGTLYVLTDTTLYAIQAPK